MIPLRDANPTQRRPVVTIGLIALCAVAFAWELGIQADGGDAGLARLFRDWALVPGDLSAALASGGAGLGHPLVTVVSSMFSTVAGST